MNVLNTLQRLVRAGLLAVALVLIVALPAFADTSYTVQ